MSLKNIVAFSLVVALGVILVVHFVLFWIYGGVFIYEDNKIILALETLMSITIIGFGLERLVNSYKSQIQLSSNHATHKVVDNKIPSPASLLYSQTGETRQLPSAF